MPKTKTKPQKTTEPYWKFLVGVYFSWYRMVFNAEAIFKGSSPRYLRLIVAMLRERSSGEWTPTKAKTDLCLFLNHAQRTQSRIRENWSLLELYKIRNEVYLNWIKQ